MTMVPNPLPAQALSTSAANALCGMRILVIEDVWIVAQSYVAMLDSLGVIVSGPAKTVAQAIAMIETAQIDAALVDMNLHGEMAFGVVDALKARGVPVVVVTGYDVAPDLEGKISTFLKKPIRAEAMITAFRSISAESKARLSA